MTEKKEVQVAEYEYSDEEFDSIDHEIAMEDVDDEYNDKPCISTCCCCCNLGLGSIMAGVIFMVSFFIYRPANNRAVAAPRMTKMTNRTRSNIVAAQCHSFLKVFNFNLKKSRIHVSNR